MSSTGHQCGPCSLCKRTSTRYFHPDNWESDKCRHFMNHVVPSALTANNHVCICRACHHDINSNIGNQDHIPRWKKLKISKTTEFCRCPVKGCSSHADVITTAINLDNIPEEIQVTGESSHFCSVHYHYIYNYQHQTLCKICGKKAKIGETFKGCPNPSLTENI